MTRDSDTHRMAETLAAPFMSGAGRNGIALPLSPLQRWLLEAGKDAARGNSASKFDQSTEARVRPISRPGIINAAR